MKIYCYHTRPIKEAYLEYKEGKHPGHILYGITHFKKYGIESIFHPYKPIVNRLFLTIHTTIKILSCKEKYDILYGTSFRGMELIIFLRACRIYRKPIAVWHHTAITTSTNKLWNSISRLFYKGIDKMFFFSSKHIEISLATGKAPANSLKLIHWGADMQFYNRLTEKYATTAPENYFITTGKENRDFTTLMPALAENSNCLTYIYTNRFFNQLNYKGIIDQYAYLPKLKVNYVQGILPYDLAIQVTNSYAVLICCLSYPYTVGLTTLVEALALGKPLIASRNPYFEMDIEKEGAGIYVDYNDTEGWTKAINYLHNNPDIAAKMGENARRLAKTIYNLENYSYELVEELKTLQSAPRL